MTSWFIDEDVPWLDRVLRDAGYREVHGIGHCDECPDYETPDIQWMTEVERRFDVLLTGDVAQRRQPGEVDALASVGAVVVWMRMSKRKAPERAARFATALPLVLQRIEEGCRRISVSGHEVRCLDS